MSLPGVIQKSDDGKYPRVVLPNLCLFPRDVNLVVILSNFVVFGDRFFALGRYLLMSNGSKLV